MPKPASNSNVVLAVGLMACASFGQEPSDDVLYRCAVVSGNARDEQSVCEGFSITRGAHAISAGLATITATNGDGSLVRLSEGLRLSFDTTELLADRGSIELENDALVHGEFQGSPVTMSHYIAEDETTVSGTAESISYDSRKGTVQLNGPATLTLGANKVVGCDLIYDLNTTDYDVGSIDDCEVVFTLAPPEDSDSSAGEPDAP